MEKLPVASCQSPVAGGQIAPPGVQTLVTLKKTLEAGISFRLALACFSRLLWFSCRLEPAAFSSRLFKLSTRHSALSTLLLLLLAACAPAVPTPTGQPTRVASLTASPDIQGAVESTLTALAPTAEAGTATATAVVTATSVPTETPIVVTLPALAGERIPPPLDITLPDDWRAVGYDVMVLNDMGTIRGVPVAVYQGEVTGGRGTIVLLWGFPNISDPFPDSGSPVEPNLWSDGLRLLRLAVLEQGCNVGTDDQRTYRIGLLSAVGTQFSAVECPELAATRGWFAGVQEGGLNFVFYAYAEGDQVIDPQRVDVFNTASQEMQAILDSVRFHVPEATPESTSAP